MDEELRKQLVGTPDEIAPHIVRVAEEFEFKDLKYHAQEKSYKSKTFSKEFEIMCGEDFGPSIHWIGDDEEVEGPKSFDIGTIILQSLPNSMALLICKRKPFTSDTKVTYFENFLYKLFKEFKQLGFIEPWPKKVWRVIKEIIGIAKAVKA